MLQGVSYVLVTVLITSTHQQSGAGGGLSIGQQVLDSWATHDWTAITGDPVKFSLGFVSIVVDVVFVTQHYVLYADNNRVIEERDEKIPLLP